MAGAAAGDAGGPLGRVALPPSGLAEPPPRRRDDGHADLARHPGGAGLVGLRALLPRRRHAGDEDAVRARHRAWRRLRPHLPRGRRGRHHLHPRRPLLRGPRQAPGRGGAGGFARAWRQGRRRARRRGGGAPGGDRRPRRRRPLRRPPRREGRDRRHRRARLLGRRPVAADRGVGAGRGGAGGRGRRRRRQRRRPARGPRHPGRRGHRPGPDRPPGQRGPDRQGPGPAPGRPHQRRLRPGRDRRRRGHARLLARQRRRRRPSPSPPRSRC